MPMLSWTTLTSGARQFVVQDAAVDIMFEGVIKMVINSINNIERFAILNWCGNEDFEPL